MSRMSTYRDARHTQRFTSGGVVAEYLNPRGEHGCFAHGQVSCLCDVVVTEPVEVVKVPRAFALVETAEDLIAAAADLWARLDVMPEDSVPSKNKWQPATSYDYLDAHTDEELRHFAQLVADGMTHKQLEALCGVTVPSSCFKIMRNAAGFHSTAHRPRADIPNDVVIRMGDAGCTAGEIRSYLIEQGLPPMKHQTISTRYKRLTGKKITVHRPRQPPISRERVGELMDEGKSRKEIRDILSSEVGRRVGLTTVQRAWHDVLKARATCEV